MAVIYTPKPSKEVKWTEFKVVQAIAAHPDSLFFYRKNFVSVPGVNSFLDWEADLLVVSNAGFLTEIEVKVTAADWAIDGKKSKWKPNRLTGNRNYSWTRVKRFFYAAPAELAARWQEFGIPDFAGVISVYKNEYSAVKSEVIRPAKDILGHRRLDEKEKMKLTRLAALRIWDLRGTVSNLISQKDQRRAELEEGINGKNN